MKSLNLTNRSIAARQLDPLARVEGACYQVRELPRGLQAKVIYARIGGELQPTNMAEVSGQDVWLDTTLSFLDPESLNPAERQAYILANL